MNEKGCLDDQEFPPPKVRVIQPAQFPFTRSLTIMSEKSCNYL